MYMAVCIDIHVYAYMCLCMCIYVHLDECMEFLYAYVSIQFYINVWYIANCILHKCLFICLCVYMYIYIDMCISIVGVCIVNCVSLI